MKVNRKSDEEERDAIRYSRSVERFRERLNEQRVQTMFDGLVPLMIRRYDKQEPVQRFVTEVGKAVIDAATVPPITRIFYLAFAREVYGRWRRYSDQTLENELDIVFAKWSARSLDPAVLNLLEQVLLLALEEAGVAKE